MSVVHRLLPEDRLCVDEVKDALGNVKGALANFCTQLAKLGENAARVRGERGRSVCVPGRGGRSVCVCQGEGGGVCVCQGEGGGVCV